MGNGEPARLKHLLGELGPRLGVPRATAVGKLWARWPEVVGPDIAAHAEPTSLREGVLRIRTPSSTWATEIGYLGDEIVRRVNEALGGDLVTEIKVWTGPGAIRERAATSPATRPSPRSESDRAAPDGPAQQASPQEALEAARAAWEKRRRGRGTTFDGASAKGS